MGAAPQLARGHGPRKAILDLAPLELECMNTLWRLDEATVRQIQKAMIVSCPRAYTTIMTIMDRLAQKGVVTRRKVGRAYLYLPNLTAEHARAHAIEQVMEGFFHGSAEELAAHLGGAPADRASPPRVPAERPGNGEGGVPSAAKPVAPKADAGAAEEFAESAEILPPTRLDEVLL